ncbi:MAG: 30S ribosomal protein S9 [Spirochaetia bacterium]
MVKNVSNGTGRRKTSVARVYLREGKGDFLINGKEISQYFSNPQQVTLILKALDVTDNTGKFDVLVNVKGGGLTGQAGACLHGLSRALVKYDESNTSALRANGFLTRDSRMVERKKFGQRGARRKFQFSKR